MEESERLKKELIRIRDQMRKNNSIEASKEYDPLIGELRKLLVGNIDFIEKILADTQIKPIREEIQKFIAKSFYSVEKYWASEISGAHSPIDAIKEFPDYGEYQERTYFELNTASKKDVKRVLFVGSGPVPITPILLAYKHINIDCIDISQEACDLAKVLTTKLGLLEYIRFIVTDILNFQSFDGYDIIWVAVLVGESNKEKSRIIRHICKHLCPGQSLVLRTAFGPGRLLYAEISMNDLQGFKIYTTNDTPYSENIQTYYVWAPE